jgi:ketosteroid isomerase-like protein
LSRLRSAAALAAGALLPAVYAASVRAALQHNLARLREGDVEPLLRWYAPDVRFRFPGDTSWAIDAHSLDELRPWLERFVRLGLQLYADEISVAGPPWNTIVVIRLHDHCDAPDGTRVYENTGVIFGHMRWGKMRDYEVFEDTERVREFDTWLASGTVEA